MTKIKTKINNKTFSYKEKTKLKEIAQEHQESFQYPILIAKVNNTLQELNQPIMENCEIEFLDCTSRIGNRIYQKGLIYLLTYAIKECFGTDKRITVSHAIDKSMYVIPNFEISEEILKTITKKMNEIAKEDLPIEKITVKRTDAIEYYRKQKEYSKADILLYNTNTYVTLYKLGNQYNYFYSKLPITTKVFTKFKLQYLNEKGFILQTPISYLNGKVTEYIHHEKMFAAFSDYAEWMDLVNIKTASDVNKMATTDDIKDVIRMSEALYNNQLLYLAKNIYEEKELIKMVLIAGPSSSGKTTTSRKLALYFKGFGLNPKVISVDDYFKERLETPKKENGKYDFESLAALDLDLFNDHMAKLLSGEEITMPTFDFVTGTKSFNKKLKLEKDDIIIIEGLHCLNEELTSSVAKENKFKIYISPLTQLNIDNHNRVSSSDTRLLRRIARDHRTRGYSVAETIESWNEVRIGEEIYVFPFQDEADYIINTANVYELGVLKVYVEPLLYTIDHDSKYYEDAKRLLNLLRLFLVIPDKYVPDDAILREFIGDGYYHD